MLRHRILGKLALRPSRDPLDPGQQTRFAISTSTGQLEIFRQRCQGEQASESTPELLVLKWPGNAGRAENSTHHPADAWPNKITEIWTINPHGYGGSEGVASLHNVALMAHAVWDHAVRLYPDTVKLIFGTSIGCVTSIYQTTFAQLDKNLGGLLLRNPPPLPQLIRSHYHRWHYGPFTKWVTQVLHGPLDSIEQASQCRVPMLLLQSEFDSIVPCAYQDMIYDAYVGPKSKFIVPNAEHNELPDGNLRLTYLHELRNSFTL